MGRFMTTTQLKPLQTASDNWNAVVAGIVALNTSMTADQVTTEMVLGAVNDGITESNSAELLDAANARITALETENATIPALQEQVKNLQGSPAEDPADISSKQEVNGKVESLATFCKNHTGDTLDMMDKLVKEGIIG